MFIKIAHILSYNKINKREYAACEYVQTHSIYKFPLFSSEHQISKGIIL